MSWKVLHLRPRSEKKVAAVCQSHDIEHYLPLREEVKSYQRRQVTVTKPLFNGYLFVNMTQLNRIHIQRTNHVIHVLSPPCEESLIRELEQIRLALEADPCLEAEQGLKAGTRVRIKQGPFMGVEGVLVMSKGKSQVRLNVEMIGHSVALDIDRHWLVSDE